MPDKLELVKRNTEEIVTEEELKALLKKKRPSAYIGYATTGKIHIGHYIPLIKVMDLVEAGFEFKFLIADLHSFLDDQKTPWELLDARAEYYEKTVKAMLESIGADLDKISFHRGKKFQLEEDYMMDVLHLAGEVTMARSRRAASEVVRFKDAPKVSGFLYPLLQTRDIVGLDVEAVLGGIDQRGIYMLARELLPDIGYEKPVCIFTPLIPGLAGGKMSASEEKSKIEVIDTHSQVEKKIKASFCKAGEVKGNWVLAFFKNVVFPVKERKTKKREEGEVVIHRPEKYGGDLSYSSYQEMEKDFASQKLHPLDAKKALADEINALLETPRNKLSRKLVEKAYPE